MRDTEHPIDLDQVVATAATIEAAVEHLRSAHDAGLDVVAHLTSGTWQTPGASTTFQHRWTEWDQGLAKMLQVGPEFSQWLRNYARDARSLDDLGLPDPGTA